MVGIQDMSGAQGTLPILHTPALPRPALQEGWKKQYVQPWLGMGTPFQLLVVPLL